MKAHWKPKIGQSYWFVDISATHVDNFTVKNWRTSHMDFILWKTGNCFQTEDQAKAAAKIIKGVFKQIQEDSPNFQEFKK